MSNKIEKQIYFGSKDEVKENIKFGEVINIIDGLTYSPDNITDDITALKVLRSSNVQNGALDLKDLVYVDGTSINYDKYTQINDILICVRNGSKNLIGKNCLIQTDIYPATHGAFMSVIRTSNPKYIFSLLNSQQAKREVYRNLSATINQITKNDLNNYKFKLHSEKLQTEIGLYLSQIDNLIATINVKINVLKDTHREMINNLNTLGEEKSVIKFSDLFVSLDGLKNVTKESFNTENTTSKYISFKNIHNQSFALEDLANVDIDNVPEQNMVKHNDILITMSSENMNEIGTTTINKLKYDNIYLNSFSKILRNKSIYDSEYLNYLLKTKESRKLIISEGQGITRINLSVNRLLNLKFNIYLDIKVQKRVSLILSQMDKLIEIEEKKLEQLEKMKKYHLQQFFN